MAKTKQKKSPKVQLPQLPKLSKTPKSVVKLSIPGVKPVKLNIKKISKI